ncbi:MAG: KOW domain-containing RNA-binding protein [Lachnospiraceae bacterium]|nr:KOW domain-containing RNA-binding protein [Lachnospiraceae bacterium]
MNQIQRGQFARSLAGHDKGRLYIIWEYDEQYVYLADGRIRTLDRLKKKKRKHVQISLETANIPEDGRTEVQSVTDMKIRKALKVKEDK